MDWRDETIHINRVQALRAAVPVETRWQRRLGGWRTRLVAVQAYIVLAAVGALGGAVGGHALKSTASTAVELKQGFDRDVRERAEERAVARFEGQERQRVLSELLGRSR